MDRWGSCDECGRWFYMPQPDDSCPVCEAAPSVVVDRDDGAAPVVDLTHAGEVSRREERVP